MSFEFVGVYKAVFLVSGKNMPYCIGLNPIFLGERVQLQSVNVVVVYDFDSVRGGDSRVLVPFFILAMIRLLFDLFLGAPTGQLCVDLKR